MSFGDIMPQFPGDYDLACGDSFDACDLTREEMFAEWKASEHEIALLRMQVDALRAQLAEMPPMPPEPKDVGF